MSATISAAPGLSATSPLIEAAALYEVIQGGACQPGAAHRVRVLDLRWSPKAPGARPLYREAHIPSALFVDLDADLSQIGGPGRHPLPPTERLAALLGRLGIDSATHVVVYDEGAGAYAARLWFMLRIHGHAKASLLNGGLAAWRAAGLPLAPGEETAAPVGPPSLRLDESRLVAHAEVRRLLLERGAGGPGKPLLLDARARPRYRGDLEPLDPRPGHIPGAVNAPFEESVVSAADPRFLSADELRKRLEGVGAAAASEVVVTCGSGVTACHTALAMELAGFAPPRLYVGSYSEWSRRAEEPVATGSEPGQLEQ